MLVGLAGKAGVGKSSLAKHWVEKYHFHRLSFAAAVKEVTVTLCLQPNRENWQAIGDGLRHLISQNIWIAIMDSKVNTHLHGDPKYQGNIVIDDVRYPNEIDYIEKKGGRILFLQRPEEDRLEARPELSDPKIRNHPSEQLNSRPGETIMYARNLDELFMKADAWFILQKPVVIKLDEKGETKEATIKDMARIRELSMKQMEEFAKIGTPAALVQAQKWARVAIQAGKSLSSLGVEMLKQEDLLDLFALQKRKKEENTAGTPG